MTLSWAGKNQEALPVAELASQGLPNDSQVASQHGRILEKLGREDEAVKRYGEALVNNPDDSLARYRLAGLLMQRGQYQTAAGHLRRAIELTPERAPVSVRVGMRLSLAKCLSELDEPEGARSAAEDALRIDPQSSAARQALRELSARRP
jgi:tetratricopeptide (TPR) repeat protein